MINLDELDEAFTAQDRYLVAEYLAHGTDDFLLTGVGEANFVVPFRYRKAGKNETEAIDLFKRDLLDFQTAEKEKYRRAGLSVRKVIYDGTAFVVPFEAREQNVSPVKLARYVAAAAMKKYNFIIEAHQKLARRRHAGLTEFSMTAAEQYITFIEKEKAGEEAAKAIRVKQVADKAKGRRSSVFGISAEEISLRTEELAQKIWKKAQKKGKAIGISTLIGLSVLGGTSLFNRGCSEKGGRSDEAPVEMYTYTRQGNVYIDFMGTEHSDSLGNISRIMELKPEITAMLIAVEGYADNAYLDGVGQATIGSGTTFYLDDKGNEIPVKDGDRVSSAEAMEHKWRFIEKEMFPLLGDELGRRCSNGELKACIGAGFCWGKKAFRNSEFYQAVKDGAGKTELSRKLTGFRKQKGLLKRAYVLSACLLEKWDGKDLLDMPIYNIPNKGYLNCAPYRLELHEIMPCEKDVIGSYKKDKQGNDVPAINADGFGVFFDNYGDIHKMMCEKASNSREDVCRVRDLIPKDMLAAINYKANRAAASIEMSYINNQER